ncbi:MAG TPA: NAD(P)/FAD-dependent oxidoreductase, partial [Mycobacteriales bacterium]|nr:NAD(P)/FAD-dependent oxidoreductase [Mycobacteriales bacterium]
MEKTYDVVVIGGGAAGLSAALTLSRARRSVLVVDAGEPRNAPAEQVHNYLGREGTPPGELYGIGRAEVQRYGGEFVTARVIRVEPGFRVTLEGDRVLRARRLLVATGLTDELPDIPGLAERWGHDVLHCPYCHGWEVRDQPIGVIAVTPMAVHQALLWRQWTDDVVLFLNAALTLTDEQRREFAARGVTVREGAVAAWQDGGVRMSDGEVVPRAAVVVQTRMHANADLLADLGLKAVEREVNGVVIGTYVPTEPTGA